MLQRRVPAGRARHTKRYPAPAPQLTGPLTLTLITTRNPATPPPTTSPAVPPPTANPPPATVTPTAGPTTTATTAPTFAPSPVPSVIVRSSATNASGTNPTAPSDSNALVTRRLPAGAIVGIVIGTVLVMMAVVLLLVRTRFRQTRKAKRSTWLARGGISSNAIPPTGKTMSSFAPAERYAETLPPMSTMPAYPSTLTRPGDTSPGVTFAQAQNRALSAYPTLSPPAATYNNLNNPSPDGPTPGTTGMTPRAILPVESATVKFTFIPSLPDELSISNGEVVKVLQEFDDGWALCVNGRGTQGMVPLECLDRGEAAVNGERLGVPNNVGAPRNSNRASSLNILPNRRSSGVLN